MTQIKYTEGLDYFTLNGKQYPQIYQAVAMGSTNIAIYGIHDIKNQLLGTTHFSEVSVNGQFYNNQKDLIQVLLPILYDKITIEKNTDTDIGNPAQEYLDLLNF